MSASEKHIFFSHYNNYYRERPSKRPYTVNQINKIINQIISAKKSTTTKTRRDYYLLKTYDTVTLNNQTSLIKILKCQGDALIYIIPEEEIFERLSVIHINCGHGSRDKMTYIIRQNASIPRPCIDMFLKSCQICQQKKNKSITAVVKPILPIIFMTRCHVNLIDFQTIADGEYKWLLNYQDDATKYLCLRPLKTKEASEIATELYKIFMQFGAPVILQSDNGREFVNLIIEQLKIKWPQLSIVLGSRESVEKASQDVEEMIKAWMRDHKSTMWSTGCYMVQFQKNNYLPKIIGRSPFEAVFGSKPNLGLSSLNIPEHLISSFRTEEELLDIENNIRNEGAIKIENEEILLGI